MCPQFICRVLPSASQKRSVRSWWHLCKLVYFSSAPFSNMAVRLSMWHCTPWAKLSVLRALLQTLRASPRPSRRRALRADWPAWETEHLEAATVSRACRGSQQGRVQGPSTEGARLLGNGCLPREMYNPGGQNARLKFTS